MSRLFSIAITVVVVSVSLSHAQTDLFQIESTESISGLGSGDLILFNQQSRYVAVGVDRGAVLYDLERKRVYSSVQCVKSRPRTAAKSRTGSLFALGCEDGSIALGRWDEPISTSMMGHPHSKRVSTLAFSPTSSQLVSGGDDHAVILWDVDSRQEIQRFKPQSHKPIAFVAFSAGGLGIIAVTQDGEITEWDAKSGRTLRRFELENNTVYGVAINEGGTLLGLSSEYVALNKGHGGSVPNAVSSSSSDASAPIAGPSVLRAGPTINPADFYREDRLLLFDLSKGLIVKQIEGVDGQLQSPSFSSDNRFLAATRRRVKQTFLSVFDLQRGVEVLAQPCFPNSKLASFSPDGRYLAGSTPSGGVALLRVSGVQLAADTGDLAGQRIRSTSSSTKPLITDSAKQAIAIMDLDPLRVEKEVGRAVAEMLRNRIVGARIRVVARDRMQEIIREQNFQVSDRTDSRKAVALGRILNADKIVFGSVSALGTTYTVNVQLVNVQTAMVEGVREVICQRCSLSDLPDVVAELGAMLVAR